jgi:hypothetical protein
MLLPIVLITLTVREEVISHHYPTVGGFDELFAISGGRKFIQEMSLRINTSQAKPLAQCYFLHKTLAPSFPKGRMLISS